jgi:hypothetical protein
METSGKALLLVMMDIAPEMEEEFNRWYDEEHVPERLSVPGFLTGRRFKAVEGTPKYLAIYELENAEVLQSDAYVKKLNEQYTEWTARMRKHFKVVARNVYVEISPPATAKG